MVGEAPPPIGCLNGATGNADPTCPSLSSPQVGAPLSNDSTLFLSVLEAVTTNPVPVVTSTNPSTALVGQPISTLTVTGTNFVPGATVLFNGISNAGTVSNGGTTITASITASELQIGGTVSVVVTNPAPGGGASNSASFTINNPVPTVTSVSPSSGLVGQAIATLTVTGTNFVTGAKVNFNGTSSTGTVSNGGTTITVSILASQLATGGTVPVNVTNPLPGGGASNSVNFTIDNPVPTVASISPNTGIVGQAISTLTVTGTNFVTGAMVSFNGTNNVGTVSNGGTTITASIVATELPSAAVIPVTVSNPTPGGGASNSVSFTINNPVPTLTSISPTTAPVGTTISPITATGTGFVTGSTLIFNGTSHAGTVSNSGTTLTATIAATELATAKSVGVTVSNPTPGGGGSNSINFVINDFSVTGPQAPVTVPAGQTASFVVNFGTQGGALATPVNFSASGLPAASTPSFTTPTMQSGTVSGSTTLMIMTTMRTSTTPFFRNLPRIQPLTLVWLTLFALIGFLSNRARRAGSTGLRLRGTWALLALSCLAVAACGSAGTPPGGGGGTPAGTYTITVTASAGTALRTTTVTLTVQ